MNALDHAVVRNRAFAAGVVNETLTTVRMEEERLPFTIRIVRDDDALQKAVAIRQAAYGRHVPEFAAKLGSPEPNDRDQGSVVLLAESKMDGSPLGTMRIQTNRYRNLAVEQSVELPAWLKGKSMAEATRLGINLGRTGRMVKIALFKALYMYCIEAGIEWLVITARPPLDRQYEALLFEDLFPGQLIAMHHVNNIPHRVLAFDVFNAESRWTQLRHPLLHFMRRTYHPDIDLSDADFSTWSEPACSTNLIDADFSLCAGPVRPPELPLRAAVSA